MPLIFRHATGVGYGANERFCQSGILLHSRDFGSYIRITAW